MMWKRILAWFKDSETILWARLQMFMAAVIAVLASFDMNLFSQYVPAQWVPIYVFVSGLITELARRARDEDLKRK